ncbi:(Fe-S)-binding protein [Halalkalibacter nanhaiisediminis]|uniref:Glycolate oxidase iron-sulfur subunit n=1 Tax=Halalkalibacter nanhaiisediminis TaxID=688079 RepID=A0A562QN06_9BACI|nr:(Fe-S)-binding protein [Halalkalibacter nanhaiisediminis]TWI58075.1 glycolate oxidase iron-sulfur subunit [Halalkalibacter nanhaiisediminis]
MSDSELYYGLAYNETFDCVQCGYCLPSCPTYQTMNKETHSPRGRINLVKAAAEGRISLATLQEPIDLCLGCRACETACPTNVQYGKILEMAKVALQREKHKKSKAKKAFSNIVFKQTIPNESLLNVMGHGLRFYQQTGLQKMAHTLGILNLLPERLAAFEKITPTVSSPSKKKKRETILKPTLKPAYKIGFFKGCIMDTMFANINDLSMKLLQESGCEVVLIEEQTCCGALQNHSGDRDIAKDLAKQNIEAFERYEFDFVVNSIGGCGAMLVEYHHLFEDDSKWYDRAKEFANKNKDISYILSKVKLPFKKEINKVATYQPSCHMSNVQKLVQEPLSLLKSVPGITYKEHADKNMCCGSAGIYNLVNYDESMKILDMKMENVKQKNPDIIVTTNPGCHLQMKLGVEREKLADSVEVVHLAELLAEACDMTID